MHEEEKQALCCRMAASLPLLRKAMGTTQAEFASAVGVTRGTIIKIERSKNMGWNMFLSLLMVISKNKEAKSLLPALDLYTAELDDFLSGGCRAEP